MVFRMRIREKKDIEGISTYFNQNMKCGNEKCR
jgi:hypothetical protein